MVSFGLHRFFYTTSRYSTIINAPVNRDDGAIEAIRDLAAYAVRLAQNSVKDMTDRVHVAEYTIRG